MIEVAKRPILPTHDELRDEGKLVQWHHGMKTIFLSHTWLGSSHPDPKGVKCKLIVALLEGILSGRTKVTGYWMARIIFGEKGISAKDLKRTFSGGYIWMDYLSIPQLDRTHQGLAIQTITSYVALADLFIVLAGPWMHDTDGSVRDVRAWGERGWCRMENLANSLSPRQKTFIVAESPTNVLSYGPNGIVGRFWFQEVVGRGDFSVDADRALLGPSIEALIEGRKAQALSEGDLIFFRFLCAIGAALLDGTGVAPPKLPLAEWLAALRFASVHDEEEGPRATGLSPLRFAVVADRPDLVEEMLGLGADVECRVTKVVPKAQRCLFLPGETILHSAAIFTGSRDAAVLQLLLAAGANTRAVQKNPPHGNALLAAIVNSKTHLVEPLLAADPTLWQVPHSAGILPMEEGLMVGKPEMTQLVLTKYAEQLKGLPPGAPVYLDCDGRRGLGAANTAADIARGRGSSHLMFAVNHIGDPRVIRQVLDAGHDPNGDCMRNMLGYGKAKMPLPIVLRVLALLGDRLRNPPHLVDRFGNVRSSPLHLACLAGNLGAVVLLLDHGARPDSQNHWRRLTPMHCAAMGGHESCIDALLARAPAGCNLAAVKDGTGRTPARRAATRGYKELAARLRELASKGGGGGMDQHASPSDQPAAAAAAHHSPREHAREPVYTQASAEAMSGVVP